MTDVYIPGVWDLLHVGHVNILEKAAALGDRLFVGVASDAVVMADKKSFPVIPLTERLVMVGALACVSESAGYYSLSFLDHLNRFLPDIMVIGEFWGNETRHKAAESWASRNNCKLVQIPYYPHQSSTRIKQRILDGQSSVPGNRDATNRNLSSNGSPDSDGGLLRTSNEEG